MEDAFAQADQLVELITTSVARIKDVYRDSSQTLPTLDTPDDTTAPLSPDFRNSLRELQGACSQLTTLLSPPAETVVVVRFVTLSLIRAILNVTKRDLGCVECKFLHYQPRIFRFIMVPL